MRVGAMSPVGGCEGIGQGKGGGKGNVVVEGKEEVNEGWKGCGG